MPKAYKRSETLQGAYQHHIALYRAISNAGNNAADGVASDGPMRSSRSQGRASPTRRYAK